MLAKLDFIFTLFYSNAKSFALLFLICLIFIFLLASVLFTSSSISNAINTSLMQEADFTLTRYVAGKEMPTPLTWADEFLEIEGVSFVIPRIYGRYYYEKKEKYFTIVGIDIYDKQSTKGLTKLVEELDIDAFTQKNNMIVGAGVKAFFDSLAYDEFYVFRPADRSKEKLYIYDSFIKGSEIISNDLIIMSQESARKILSLSENEVTDILVNASSKEELQTIYTKLIISHFDMQILTKEEMLKYYKNLFNYKSGVFLVLYLIATLLFLLIIYQRYTILKNSDVKEIAILRLLGWKIDELLFFKMFESAFVIICAYLLGVIMAFGYVFTLGAPILKQIFLGASNLSSEAIYFAPFLDFSQLFLLFLLFVVPFLLAIFIPLWRLCTLEPSESLR